MGAHAPAVRAAPDRRRQELIDAAMACLAEHGATGTSVRAICARAGVSPGLLTHYFPGVDALIVATCREVCARAARALEAAADGAGTDPVARFHAYIAASFRPPIADPALLATWVAFWSLVPSVPAVAAVHREFYVRNQEAIVALIRRCAPALGAAAARTAAVAITATVDGLWLELCLGDTPLAAAQAERIAIDVADRLVAAPLAAV